MINNTNSLKSLSLSLKEIREVLEKLSYKQILISHYNYLQAELSELQNSISQTATLINLIDLEDTLSWERVSKLVQNSENRPKKWIDYFQEEEKTVLQKSVPSLSNNDEMIQQYMSLIKRMEQCIEQNIKPESDEGFQLGTELIDLTNESFAGDTVLMEQFWEIRKLPSEETGLFPISKEVMEFAEQCIVCAESGADS